MGVETLKRLVPETIKRHIPLRAHSLEEFIALVEKWRGMTVEAIPQIIVKGATNTVAVGMIGIYEYSTKFKSHTSTGRPIIFEEKHGKRFGSSKGFADAEERGMFALKILLTADDRLKGIKERIPIVETAIIGSEGRFDEQTYQRMHEDAKKHDISPFNSNTCHTSKV